jgi:hypothetical protein
MFNLLRGQLVRVSETQRLFSTVRLSGSTRLSGSHPGTNQSSPTVLTSIYKSYPHQTFSSSSWCCSKSQIFSQQIRFKSDFPSEHNENKQIGEEKRKEEEFR